MRILAFETLANKVSTAILQDGKIIDFSISSDETKQSESLVLEIEKILNKNHLWYQDFDFIACSNGPASFTGTRIALSCARTIKIATNLPLILLNSCEIIAYKYRDKANVVALIQANPNEFFFAKSAEEPVLVKVENLSQIFPKEKFYLCGSGKKFASSILQDRNFEISNNEDVINADLIALLAYEKIKNDSVKFDDLSPIYLRSPNITQRKK